VAVAVAVVVQAVAVVQVATVVEILLEFSLQQME